MSNRTTSAPTNTTIGDTAGSSPARRWLAISRIAVGFIFLWAILDKTFGLGYATPSAKAWIHGGSPTAGFLGHVEVGPFRSVPSSHPWVAPSSTGCSCSGCSASDWPSC